MKVGDKVIVKDNLESELRKLTFHEETCMAMAERFVGTEQEVLALWTNDDGQEYATVDLCCEIPVQCLEVKLSVYKVITLCGSTRFKEEFMREQKRLTLEGKIVISVGLFGHSGDNEVWEGMDEDTLTNTKIMLDDMHKRKIDMADEIFVINKGGYIGTSTKSEIEYAKSKNIPVKYME